MTNDMHHLTQEQRAAVLLAGLSMLEAIGFDPTSERGSDAAHRIGVRVELNPNDVQDVLSFSQRLLDRYLTASAADADAFDDDGWQLPLW